MNDIQLQKLVNRCQILEQSEQIEELQNCLYQIYCTFNRPRGGRYILNYPNKDNLSLCFSFMLHYDWEHDPQIREVWAEDGFYCIIEHIFSHLDDPSFGRQGHGEALIMLFVLLSVGRDSLKPEIQRILDKAMFMNPIFHRDDYIKGAQHVIDQFSFLAINGIKELLGERAIPVMFQITTRYNAISFFENTIKRNDLMVYEANHIWRKAEFIKDVIGHVLSNV